MNFAVWKVGGDYVPVEDPICMFEVWALGSVDFL